MFLIPLLTRPDVGYLSHPKTFAIKYGSALPPTGTVRAVCDETAAQGAICAKPRGVRRDRKDQEGRVFSKP
jgi:hypothetical protein